MASTPRDLVASVSSALRVSASTVANIDRKLMEAGLRTKKGRGRGSAIMTFADASMVALAVAATSDEISSAPECVEIVREFAPVRGSQGKLSELCAIIGGSPSEYKKFGAVMDGIMRHASETKGGVVGISLEITISDGWPRASSILIKKAESRVGITFGGSEWVAASGMIIRRVVPGAALQRIANDLD